MQTFAAKNTQEFEFGLDSWISMDYLGLGLASSGQLRDLT
jgi:hypothetical protein